MSRIAVLHPDLGIGGAERLIVDASKAMQEAGHSVQIYTGYHDKNRCFKETQDGTLEVTTVGSFIPRAIFGKCHALMAYIKMIYIAIYLLLLSNHDLVLCDQVSACIPFLRLNPRRRLKVVFYCHFPDQLLTSRNTYLKYFYRKPIDWFEEWTTSLADVILVNSEFTSSVVKKTFKSIKNRDLTVLYPCVDVESLNECQPSSENLSSIVKKCIKISENHFVFLSLNRFERKKNLGLAISAMKKCIRDYEKVNKEGQLMKAHLIVAGGYDERLLDCVQYYEELRRQVDDLELNNYVTFVKSPSDNEKLWLLRLSHAILYTPENEHFGIVPLEAMAMSKPVIACSSGGPLETIEMDINGILCDSDDDSFAEAMVRLFSDRELKDRMGAAGLERVKRRFSFETFANRLNEICYPSEI